MIVIQDHAIVPFQTAEVAQLLRDGTAQLIAEQKETLQTAEITQLLRDRTA